MSSGNKAVITAALAGARTSKEQNPAVPYGAPEIIEEAVKCYNSGAAAVHIHVRDREGQPTEDPRLVGEVVEGIRARCPILINLSSAIAAGKPPEARISVVKNFAPDLASLNTSTMNFARADWASGKIVYETVFTNTFQMIQDFNAEMKKARTKPEIEVYDIGHVHNVLLLRRQGIFEEPLLFQFVFGVAGGIRLDPLSFAHFLCEIPPDAVWSACGIGPNSFRACMMAAASGGNLRVGLEDNLYLTGKTLARGNWELVERAVQIARLADREPATPAEAREIFHLPKR